MSRSPSAPSDPHEGSHTFGLDHQGSGHCRQESFFKGHWVSKAPGSGSHAFKNDKCLSSWFLGLACSDSDSGSWGGKWGNIPGNLQLVKEAGIEGPHVPDRCVGFL